jgi:hypothetical protein
MDTQFYSLHLPFSLSEQCAGDAARRKEASGATQVISLKGLCHEMNIYFEGL